MLWDSSAILALLDADDVDHATAIAVARQIASEARPSFVTNYIEVETHALLVRKLGRTIARQWLLTGGLPVVRAMPAEEQSAKEILARHNTRTGPCVTRSRSRFSTPAASRERSRSTTISAVRADSVLGVKR